MSFFQRYPQPEEIQERVQRLHAEAEHARRLAQITRPRTSYRMRLAGALRALASRLDGHPAMPEIAPPEPAMVHYH